MGSSDDDLQIKGQLLGTTTKTGVLDRQRDSRSQAPEERPELGRTGSELGDQCENSDDLPAGEEWGGLPLFHGAVLVPEDATWENREVAGVSARR